MNTHQLISDLRSRGLELEADGDTLRLRGPREELTEETQERVRAQKPAVLRRLREECVCRAVAERVRAVTPPGLGHWDPAWDIVRGPTDRFLDALDAWLEEDTRGTRDTLQMAVDSLVGAWRNAAGHWKAEGRPETRGHEVGT